MSDCTIVTSEQHLYQTIIQFDETIVLPRKLATGNIHDYFFSYCPLVGILFEVLRIVSPHPLPGGLNGMWGDFDYVLVNCFSHTLSLRAYWDVRGFSLCTCELFLTYPLLEGLLECEGIFIMYLSIVSPTPSPLGTYQDVRGFSFNMHFCVLQIVILELATKISLEWVLCVELSTFSWSNRRYPGSVFLCIWMILYHIFYNFVVIRNRFW